MRTLAPSAAPTPHAAAGAKPRLLFFQWDHSPNRGISDYFCSHMNEHVRCLSIYFDVTVINHDCDYARMCDLHRPDLVLFESGYQTFVSRRPEIRNVRPDDRIPRVGLHNADAWSDCRAGFLSDMDRWGIDTYFSISTTTHEYLPAARSGMYIWPNFVNPAVFRDYGLEKTIPVMLSGQCHEAYPWREKVFPLVGQMFASLVCPTFYNGSGLSNRTLSGEPYARALNASLFSPACGTVAGEVVRKHLEIPGAKACLVTEESAALKEAGFVHMENCVFAGPDDVVEVMDALMRDRGELRRLTENGFRLVHTRHTAEQRPQVYQWFVLQANMADNERIVQHGPFADLVLEPATDAVDPPIFVSRGVFTAVLKRANAKLWQGDTGAARADFETCLRYVKYLPEARFGLALCALGEGRPDEAANILAGLVANSVETYGAADPDPLEWTYFLVCLLARGEVERARSLLDWYPAAIHMDRRRLEKILKPGGPSAYPAATADRPSIHAVPDRSAEAWAAWLDLVLRRCGQPGLAAVLVPAAHSAAQPAPVLPARAKGNGVVPNALLRLLDLALRLPGLAGIRPKVPPSPEFNYLHHVGLSVRRQLTRGPGADLLRTEWRKRRARRETDLIRAQAAARGRLLAVEPKDRGGFPHPARE